MKKALLGGIIAAAGAAAIAIPSAAPARTYSSFSLYVGDGGGYYAPGYYDEPAYGYYYPGYSSYYYPGYGGYDRSDRWSHRRWDHDGRHRDWDRGRSRHHRWHDRDHDDD